MKIEQFYIAIDLLQERITGKHVEIFCWNTMSKSKGDVVLKWSGYYPGSTPENKASAQRVWRMNRRAGNCRMAKVRVTLIEI